MDDRALAATLKHRLRQTASEQDPLRLERHAISQHVRRALLEGANENASPPVGLMDRFGRSSHPMIKDAVACALASPVAPERITRGDTETDMRRSIDGPRMARDLVIL